MAQYTQCVQNLLNLLGSLPGIGARSAERIAFHILKQSKEEAMRRAFTGRIWCVNATRTLWCRD